MAGRGGKRPGAGAKSKSETSAIRALIDASITPAQWKQIFKRLRVIATSKTSPPSTVVAAADFLCKYRFGVPVQLIAGDPEGAPIEIIEFARAALPAPPQLRELGDGG